MLNPVEPIRYREYANPIRRMGAVGDGRTIALVRDDGLIPYFPWPFLDSPTIFSSLLSQAPLSHTAFALAPPAAPVSQCYRGDTNVLVTRIANGETRIAITDAMLPAPRPGDRRLLLRELRCEEGTANVTFSAHPRPDYERTDAALVQVSATRIEATQGEGLAISASFPIHVEGDGAQGRITLEPGETAWVAFHLAADPLADFDPADAIAAAESEWKQRLGDWQPEGAHADVVRRSMLAMLLVENIETGGLHAAGTFGLPESPNGARNWDYRYVWVRDTALAARAAALAGLPQVAERWLEFAVMSNCECSQGPLRLMLRSDEGAVPDEAELDHFEGCMNATPVRIGNGAEGQLQLDIYGEVVMALKTLSDSGRSISAPMMERMGRCLDWLAENWDRKDSSIWEIRGNEKRYLFSHLMCWLAFRDFEEISRREGGEPNTLWQQAREDVAAAIRERHWSEEKQGYMQTCEGHMVDAAAIQMRLTGFLERDDPRWCSTKESIRKALVKDYGVLRYPHAAHDGFECEEGAFVLCTGWWAQALHLDGEHDEARHWLDIMLKSCGETGLASEETGERNLALGNVPQCFSHAALIETILVLNG